MKNSLESVAKLDWHRMAISERCVTIRGESYSLGSTLSFTSLRDDLREVWTVQETMRVGEISDQYIHVLNNF